MNRNRIIIGAAAVLVLALIGFLLLYEPNRPEPTTAVVLPETAPTTAEPTQPAVDQPTRAEPQPEVQKTEVEPAEQQAPAATAAPAPPSFDVVRVEPNGDAVLAGRAAAGSDVTVLDGAASLGNVLTNPQGQWAYVVETPLAPGSHELSLRSRLADGRVIESSDVVVVTIPHPQIAAEIGRAHV